MRSIDFTSVASLMIAVLIVAGCENRNAGTSPNPAVASSTTQAAAPAKAASITASPNPVPAGDGLGTTRITWSAGGPWGQVYISQDGKEDTTMFTEGGQGSTDAPWIRTGHTYEFRVFAGKDHKQMLAKVLVTRAK